MISLEQARLLEERVSKAIEYVKRLKSENAALVSEKNALLSKLEANQKRLDKLEAHVLSFKEDQGRIEDGILAALDRLSQFEEAFENSLKESKPKQKKTPAPKETEQNEVFFDVEKEEVDSESSEKDAELDIF